MHTLILRYEYLSILHVVLHYSEEAVFILIYILDYKGGQFLYPRHFLDHFWSLYSSLDHQEKCQIKAVASRILNLILIRAKGPEKIYLQLVGSTKPSC